MKKRGACLSAAWAPCPLGWLCCRALGTSQERGNSTAALSTQGASPGWMCTFVQAAPTPRPGLSLFLDSGSCVSPVGLGQLLSCSQMVSLSPYSSGSGPTGVFPVRSQGGLLGGICRRIQGSGPRGARPPDQPLTALLAHLLFGVALLLLLRVVVLVYRLLKRSFRVFLLPHPAE